MTKKVVLRLNRLSELRMTPYCIQLTSGVVGTDFTVARPMGRNGKHLAGSLASGILSKIQVKNPKIQVVRWCFEELVVFKMQCMRGKTIKCQYAFPIECFHLVVSLGFFKIPWMFHFEFFQIPQFYNSRKFKIPRPRRNSKFQAVNAIFQTTSTSKNLVRTNVHKKPS